MIIASYGMAAHIAAVAQSRNDGLDAAATNLISNVTTYCNTVEHHSNSVPRIFARITSADDSSAWIDDRRADRDKNHRGQNK